MLFSAYVRATVTHLNKQAIISLDYFTNLGFVSSIDR